MARSNEPSPERSRRPASQRSGPDTRAASKREAIITAAERLFAERGYDASSTARIAQEAGVPSGLVFYHFPSKLDLLLAIVHERPEPSQVSAVSVHNKPIRARLRQATRALAEELERNRYSRVIVFRESHSHPEIANRASELFSEATAAVAHVLADGDDVIDDPRQVRAAAELIVSRVFVDVVALGDVATLLQRNSAMLSLLEHALVKPQ